MCSAVGLCSQELQVNEEYVEKETEFDVNEETEQLPVKCVYCRVQCTLPVLRCLRQHARFRGESC